MATRAEFEALMQQRIQEGDIDKANRIRTEKLGLPPIDRPIASNTDPQLQVDSGDLRQQMGSGNTLQFGYPGLTPVFDTGIGMPQGLTEGLAGMGRRFSEIGTLGMHETPPEAAALLDDSGYAMVGGIGADLATLALGGSALRSAGLGGTWAGSALSNPQSLVQAGVGGGAYGAATSPDRVEGATGGAIGGALGFGIPAAIGRAVSPNIAAPARELMDSGYTLTPGEIFGGTTKRFEDAATSIPILGDAIKGAQHRSIAQFNNKMLNDALAPIGQQLDPSMGAGREAIENAQKVVSTEYGDILKNMNVRLDDQFLSEIGTLKEMAKQLPKKEYKKFLNEIDDKLLSKFDNENQLLLGETFKETDSGLRQLYKKAKKSMDLYQNDLGNALHSAHKSLLDLAKRQNPDMAARLSKADQSYAKLSRIEDASSYVGAHEGVFTPSHLLQSIRKNTGRKDYAAGRGFDQESVEGFKGALSQTIPDSGTTTRALINMATLGGGAAMSPGALAGLLGSAAAYTRPGQKVMQGVLASRPAYAGPLRTMIEETSPYAGLLGIGAGTNFK